MATQEDRGHCSVGLISRRTRPQCRGKTLMRFPSLPRRLAAAALCVVALSACGGGGGGSGSAPATNHPVTLAWAPNHEKGVNSAGGGYQVAISGQPTIEVSFISGSAAPTSTVTTLHTGIYTVTVSAVAALDAQGSSTGSRSEPSQPFTVIVP